MFDTVHTPERCGQLKCFGRGLADLSIGDRVVLHRDLEIDEARVTDLPTPTAAPSAKTRRRSDRVLSAVSDDENYEIKMHEGGFLHIRSGVIVGWDGTFDPSLPCFDGYGRVVAVVGLVGGEECISAGLCEQCSGHSTDWSELLSLFSESDHRD